MTKTIGWGIIGLGNIAQSFASDLKLVNEGMLVAVASRSKEKAEEFGKKNDAKLVLAATRNCLSAAR